MTITIVITPDRKCGWSVNDDMPGSDGLGIWRFWKRHQLSFLRWASRVGFLLWASQVGSRLWASPVGNLLGTSPVGCLMGTGQVGCWLGPCRRSVEVVFWPWCWEVWVSTVETYVWVFGSRPAKMKEIWSSTRYAERLNFVSMVRYEGLLRIVCVSLSPLVSKSRAQKLTS